jgi:hypothetical protein
MQTCRHADKTQTIRGLIIFHLWRENALSISAAAAAEDADADQFVVQLKMRRSRLNSKIWTADHHHMARDGKR